ncbi:50S ribosomal protein L5p (L11e) [Chitinispirillum alkaliphilum]|nr:50S ribosomal protein L5p (L11e) [Chitinispirillum alkaliphilum]
MSTGTKQKPRMREMYEKTVVPALQKKFSYKNVMQVPVIDKIVINMGVGDAVSDAKLLDEALMCVREISGQKPIVTRAKKAISNFKLREGMPIGCKVTLRGQMMWEFFDRLVSIAIPRIRDFRGLPRKSFDGNGNYTMGVKEQIVFLEIDRDKISRITGMDICIGTTASTNEEGLALLQELGMPFRK